MRCQVSRKRRTLALAGGKYTVGWVWDAGRKAQKPLFKQSFICVQSKTKLETVHKLCKTLRTLASKNTPNKYVVAFMWSTETSSKWSTILQNIRYFDAQQNLPVSHVNTTSSTVSLQPDRWKHLTNLTGECLLRFLVNVITEGTSYKRQLLKYAKLHSL
jgi:hypothetical protein